LWPNPKSRLRIACESGRMRFGKRMVDPMAGRTNTGGKPDPRWMPRKPNLATKALKVLRRKHAQRPGQLRPAVERRGYRGARVGSFRTRHRCRAACLGEHGVAVEINATLPHSLAHAGARAASRIAQLFNEEPFTGLVRMIFAASYSPARKPASTDLRDPSSYISLARHQPLHLLMPACAHPSPSLPRCSLSAARAISNASAINSKVG
jgi:hypothetical protein